MGEIAPSQRTKLLVGLWRFGLLGVILLLIACPMLAAIIGLLVDSRLDADAWVAIGFMSLLLGGFLLAGLWQGARLALRLLDLSAGRVEQGDGRLTWRKSRYLPETQERRLTLMDGLSLTPGAYRFYFLPRSGLVVNVEALGSSAFANAGSRDEDELTRALAEANRLQVEAYPNYRLGQMDEADKQRRISRAVLGMGITLLVATAIGIFFTVLFLSDADDGEAWIILLCFGGFDVLFSGFILWSIWRTITDLREGQVLMREGPVRRTVVRSSKSASYYYVLNDLRFSVSPAGYAALVEGRPYRIYYLPRSKTLLGIEPTVHEDAGGWSTRMK
jgi:hypothetical protein